MKDLCTCIMHNKQLIILLYCELRIRNHCSSMERARALTQRAIVVRFSLRLKWKIAKFANNANATNEDAPSIVSHADLTQLCCNYLLFLIFLFFRFISCKNAVNKRKNDRLSCDYDIGNPFNIFFFFLQKF